MACLPDRCGEAYAVVIRGPGCHRSSQMTTYSTSADMASSFHLEGASSDCVSLSHWAPAKDLVAVAEAAVFKQMQGTVSKHLHAWDAGMINTLRPMSLEDQPEASTSGSDLGKGRFGAVSVGRFGTDEFALKRGDFIPLDKLLGSSFALEVVTAVAARHPNIVHTLGWFLEAHEVEGGERNVHFRTVLVMEKLDCSLQQYALSHKMAVEDLAVVLMKVVEAVSHMAAMGMVHSDIKTDNILLSHAESSSDVAGAAPTLTQVKLCDFGMAGFVDPSTGTMKKRGGSEWFLAEDESELVPFATDIFGVGRVGLDVLDERMFKVLNRALMSNLKSRPRRRDLMDLSEMMQPDRLDRRPKVQSVLTELKAFLKKCPCPTACGFNPDELEESVAVVEPTAAAAPESRVPLSERRRMSISISTSCLHGLSAEASAEEELSDVPDNAVDASPRSNDQSPLASCRSLSSPFLFKLVAVQGALKFL
eukprot:gene3224-13246_t